LFTSSFIKIPPLVVYEISWLQTGQTVTVDISSAQSNCASLTT